MRKFSKVVFIFCVVLVMNLSACNSEEPARELSVLLHMAEYEAIISGYPEEDYGDMNGFLQEVEVADSINDLVWKVGILLPYAPSDGKVYPVLYLLHGKDGKGVNWEKVLGITGILDYYYGKGLEDMVVVMPDASNSYYVDSYENDIRYESFFHEILMPYIESNYPVSKNREETFIGGYSMGGYGAAYYGYKYPDKFSLSYAMSAPLDGNSNSLTPPFLQFASEENIHLLPELIIDVGNRDRFAGVNIEAHLALSYLSIPHEFILREGGHDPDFWHESLLILFERIRQKLAEY